MVNQEISEEELWEKVTGKKKMAQKNETASKRWRPTNRFHLTVSSVKQPIFMAEKGEQLKSTDLLRFLFEIMKKSAPELEEETPMEKRVKTLENEVKKLKELLFPKPQVSKADGVYERFREKLEQENFGKIVAIEIQSETIAGIGDNVLEAYKEAKAKFPESKFSFKRVGYPYLFKW